ncbi:uncharacterized protein GGS25DRAFT_523481 [Hypoxylon fragiforme]|uniref:uncharacterized protein n=1 Tax=Hypoxylon fragiforme TaxID=63214 RepID=UPI0020C62A6C|nr:uncharacterized protein GGS25DRAFT_523481 [Hypoxylon fragiforme]KAI2605807.1 hypothetical protein GGS25DRAFT_523481 [Hypoxylon fragiforme]
MDPNADQSDSGNIFANYPFSWILVPLIIFVGVGTLLLCYRYRRRQKLRMQYGTSALERDIEAMGRRSRSRVMHDRRTRERGLGIGVGSREEGLNELGEAPPAYTAPQKRPDNGEDVELSPIQPLSGVAVIDGAGTSSPPTYDELRQQPAHPPQSTVPTPTSNMPEPPPRAVLGSN